MMHSETFGLLGLFLVPLMAQTPTVSIKPVDLPGIQVWSATDEAVQPFVGSVLSSTTSTAVAGLLPYSLVLRNNSGQRVSAYVIRASYVNSVGVSGARTRTYFNLWREPNGMEIPPGGVRLVTLSDSLAASMGTPSRSARTGVPQEADRVLGTLARQQAVAISLDLLVLEDGQVFGADESNGLSYIKAYFYAERVLASDIQSQLSGGYSLADVVVYLDRIATQPIEPLGANDVAVVRRSRARRLLLFAKTSKKALESEVDRVLGNAVFKFSR